MPLQFGERLLHAFVLVTAVALNDRTLLAQNSSAPIEFRVAPDGVRPFYLSSGSRASLSGLLEASRRSSGFRETAARISRSRRCFRPN